MQYVGVDGCREGWLAVALQGDENFDVRMARNIDKIWELYQNAKLILIDIPIGLRDKNIAWRLCDIEAYRRLGRRRFSVFWTPCRSATKVFDYNEANRVKMTFNKKTEPGSEERIRILNRYFHQTRNVIRRAESKYGSNIAKDDILDALAAAITATKEDLRPATLPSEPEIDSLTLLFCCIHSKYTNALGLHWLNNCIESINIQPHAAFQ